MWPNRATIAMVRMLGRWAVLAQVRYTGRHLEADLRHYIKRGSGRHGRGLRHNSGAAAVLGAWLALTLEVCLERVGSVAQVSAPDDAHHRSEQAKGALGSHLKLVVDARRVTVLGEMEPVPALQRPNVGDNSHAFGP